MSCRGVYFSLSDEQVSRIMAARTDDQVLEIVEAIEEDWDEDHLLEVDKSWDAMHRCLTDGTLDPKGGDYPLNRCVLNGRQLYSGEDYVISFVPANEVPDVAAALQPIAKESCREKFFALTDYEGPQDEDDWDYTWSYLEAVREFFQKAAGQTRAVIFTVDQ